MEQAPNVFVIAVTDTSITFGWNIPGNTPNVLLIKRNSPNPMVIGEFTSNDPGFYWSSYQDTDLHPGILYSYSVCCVYSDKTLCGSVMQWTLGSQPVPPPPETSPAPVITGLQVHPYSITVTWRSDITYSKFLI